MQKRIVKSKLIKKYLGDVIGEYGFKYAGAGSGVWEFHRQKGYIQQEIMIQQDRFFPDHVKLVFHTSANGWDDQEIGDLLPEYKGQEYWKYNSEEEYIEVLQFFVDTVKEKGFDLLEEMSVPKDPVYATPEMEMELYENYQKLIKEAHTKYFFKRTGEEGIKTLSNYVCQYKNKEYDDVKELLVELGSVYIEILINDFGGEITLEPNLYRCYVMKQNDVICWPLFHIVSYWKDCHLQREGINWILQYYKLAEI